MSGLAEPRRIAAALFLVLAACSGGDQDLRSDDHFPAVRAAGAHPDMTSLASTSNGLILIGVGDIASCNQRGDEITARLLDRREGLVFTIGDNAYPRGTISDYRRCYEPSWGRHRDRTLPAPGDHDEADGYYEYFGPAAGERGVGWYSYDVGSWHIVVLNVNRSLEPGSSQMRWLEADLAGHDTRCAMAILHYPLFSSGGHHGSIREVRPVWEVLHRHGVDLVLSGHDHHYERFAPQDPSGNPDPRGPRQFIIGTGGRHLRRLAREPLPNSLVRDDQTFGVIALRLDGQGFGWRFIPEPGSRFSDAGSAICSD